ncbi:ABC transporter [Sphingobium sp.]|uniref:Gldg family protein n=1 Tax=Sphingobium sp. TaxID=1912891 RepID=UPI0026046279|nr:ABC transporter [Sphingobium sp.]
MKAACVRFLWLWPPSIGLFLAGLYRALLTGQVDPWDWGAPAAVALAGAGFVLARHSWRMRIWLALGGVGSVLLFCTLAAARAPDPLAALGLVVVGVLTVSAGAMLRKSPSASSEVEKLSRNASRLRLRQTGVGLLLLLFTILLLWRGPAQPVHPVPDRPALAVITGLPLFWDEMGRAGPRDAPIITLLRTRFTVTPLDDPLQLKASPARRLLLAQPRALAPAQLVAIDQWVRDGGTVLVLADPLLRWPSDLPLGDRRRAPSVSLLQPLLTHWGFRPIDIKAAEIRDRTPDGYVVTLSGVQLFLTGPDDRIVGPNDWIVHRKPMGRGEVLLLGDADPIDDRLWLADPARPLDPRYWVADTPARVVHWLGGAPIPGDRRWMQDAQGVAQAVGRTLLAGMIWAIMGALLFRRERPGSSHGTKGEDGGMKDNKSG